MKTQREILRQTWSDMKQRCYNTRSVQFKNYGARGIIVCNRWLESFDNFAVDMGPRPNGMSIERIDTNGNYEPSNCKWASNQEQRKNQRRCVFLTLNGKTMTVEEWGRELGLHPTTVRTRLKRNYPLEKILFSGRFPSTLPAFAAARKEKE